MARVPRPTTSDYNVAAVTHIRALAALTLLDLQECSQGAPYNDENGEMERYLDATNVVYQVCWRHVDGTDTEVVADIRAHHAVKQVLEAVCGNGDIDAALDVLESRVSFREVFGATGAAAGATTGATAGATTSSSWPLKFFFDLPEHDTLLHKVVRSTPLPLVALVFLCASNCSDRHVALSRFLERALAVVSIAEIRACVHEHVCGVIDCIC